MDYLKRMQSRFTPEMWAAYNEAYEKVREDGPRYDREPWPEPEMPTKEVVLLKMATIAGEMEGLRDWAKERGIKSEFLGT